MLLLHLYAVYLGIGQSYNKIEVTLQQPPSYIYMLH